MTPGGTAAPGRGVEVVTFGCRLNGVESEAMHRLASAAGHRNLTIVNTCAVTAEAVRQGRQAIRRLKRDRPEGVLVVTGCAATIEPAAFATMPGVDHVVGNAVKQSPTIWADLAPLGQGRRAPSSASWSPAALPPTQTRGFVEVQNGCDHRCTFCVIPFGRGLSRSVGEGEVLARVRTLVARGALEVVLTGVDITAYGADLPGHPTLGRLVQDLLAAVPDLPRLRLSSLDCIEADARLVDAIANEPRLMPHLHLSLQSGSDLILKRMKRRHDRAEAIAFCRRLRRLRPGLVLGADIITGFPTETDAMFADSLSLVEACGLTHLNVFPYSPRPGTPAARMPQVPREIARERAERLRAAGERALRTHLLGQRSAGACPS